MQFEDSKPSTDIYLEMNRADGTIPTPDTDDHSIADIGSNELRALIDSWYIPELM